MGIPPFRTHLSHSTIHHKVSSIHKAALVAGQEDHSMGLLNSLAEATGGEVHFAAETLRLVITQPVLQKRSAEIM